MLISDVKYYLRNSNEFDLFMPDFVFFFISRICSFRAKQK